MKFAFIQAQKARFPVRRLCAVLGVTRSGFYAWGARPEAARTRANRQLALEVAALYRARRQRYGSPRIYHELRAQGCRVGRHRVARLLRAQGLRARPKRGFQPPIAARPAAAVAANLLARVFTAPAPNCAWVADITALRTREGWLYLAVLLDLFSRRVVGWAMSAHPTRQLTLDALGAALAQRRPAPGLLHHSDRGSPYTSAEYQAALRTHGVVSSMSRKGNCWDNAVAESFFATLKSELAPAARWPTRAAARGAVFEYLEVFYNRCRRHSSLGYLTPVAFEQRYRQNPQAA
jgi:transposase InsO family protein